MAWWHRLWSIPEKSSVDKPPGIVCLIGESGSGKTSLAQAMEPFGFTSIPSYTTRPARGSHEKGHLFVDQPTFDGLRSELVAYQKFDSFEYGATRQQIADHHIYVIDPNGLIQLKAALPDVPVVVIYLQTSPSERLRRMVQTRGSDDALRRLDHDTAYFHGFRAYDMVLVNENEQDRLRNEQLLRAILVEMFH